MSAFFTIEFELHSTFVDTEHSVHQCGNGDSAPSSSPDILAIGLHGDPAIRRHEHLMGMVPQELDCIGADGSNLGSRDSFAFVSHAQSNLNSDTLGDAHVLQLILSWDTDAIDGPFGDFP